MNAIRQLEELGFSLDLNGDAILFAHDGTPSDPATVRGLLDALRRDKAQAVAFLRDRGNVSQGVANLHTDSPFAHPPVPADPRPDLVEDSAAWRVLLRMAWPLDGDDPSGLYGALAGLRCCGCGLQHDGARWRLVAGQMDTAEYDRDRGLYLRPHHDLLLFLLDALGQPQEAPIEEP